jgi:hypothetical protein
VASATCGKALDQLCGEPVGAGQATGLARHAERLRHWLPKGQLLPEHIWRRRHSTIVALLWWDVAGRTAFGLLQGQSLRHMLVGGGAIEAHFHFFVMIGVLTLYQDWMPFLVAIGYVVVHHGMAGVLAPESVYSHAAAVGHPWRWALIHGGFVLAASAAHIVAWRTTRTSFCATR